MGCTADEETDNTLAIWLIRFFTSDGQTNLLETINSNGQECVSQTYRIASFSISKSKEYTKLSGSQTKQFQRLVYLEFVVH